jgi:dTDP-4-amino-4,6-dideoxygalactose transaminase
MKQIPFADLKRQYSAIKKEVLREIKTVCNETAFSGGKFSEKFDKEFAKYSGGKYFSGLNNGTSALHLAMLTLGIGPGDEVIVPANTFIATAWGVSYTGATPVFVDCDAKTWEIDAEKIEKSITKKTKAIIGVHLYGQPFDIDAVKKICKKHKLFLIEDCAQAHGAKYKNKIVGTFGSLGCFSFYPGKNLGCYGEGGGILTNNKKYFEHIEKLKNHGSMTKYYHDEIGYNMRMEGIQGAVLSLKLKHLNGWNVRRKEIAEMYHRLIVNPKIKMQFSPKWSNSVYHLFVIVTEKRNELKKYLEKNNIFPGLHYPVPCHLQKAYAFLKYKKRDCPNSEYLASHCLSLPMFPELTNKEVQKIVRCINSYNE